MSLAILFHFLCAQHVSDINISIIRSLRLFCWITTLVILFLVGCVLEFRCGWVGVVSVLQASDILMSEICRAHKKWNKIASDIKLVFYSSTITMTHGPIYIRIHRCKYTHKNPQFKKSWHKNLLIFKWMLYVKLSISPSKRNCRDVKSTINHTAQCSGVYCVYQLI